MFLHRVGAELLLITLTLWLQSAGVAALIAWVRRALGRGARKIGTLRSAALVVRLAMAVAFCTDWRFSCGQVSIVGVACRRGTRRSTSRQAVIQLLAAVT